MSGNEDKVEAMTSIQASEESPFHVGEQKVQERLGVRDIEAWARKVVRPYLPEEHRQFHTSLPFLVVAARDALGRPWASLLTGADGFVDSPDPRTLTIDAEPLPGDALETAFETGADVGILGIELATRRRNRVNGRLTESARGRLTFAVEQSFGNCPQYIRERNWRRVEGEPKGAVTRGQALSESQRAWIEAADTLFIASGYRGQGESPTFGMDASHRGGDPGLVRVESERHVWFPDYAGNNHLNTMGNLLLDQRAGLLFVDFETGSLLQLTGRATIDWDSDEVARVPGARRIVSLEIDEVVELREAVPLRWDATADSVRSLRLIEKIPESESVTSFVFEARDGGPLPDFIAGQHLPIEIPVSGIEQPVRRTYSLSGPPSGERYRISVKREAKGLASRQLHDQTELGAILDARKPAGDFLLPCGTCPVVLVSAGVGLTPMVSMLHALAAENGDRPVWFLHGARDGDHHPLADEVRALAAARPGIQAHVAYSQPRPQDRLGVDYDSAGRIDGALIASLVSAPEAHYLLCGPVGFMAGVQDALEAQGVSAEQIHRESFGPIG